VGDSMAGGKFSAEICSASTFLMFSRKTAHLKNLSQVVGDSSQGILGAAQQPSASAGQFGTSGVYLALPVGLMPHQTEGQASQTTRKDYQSLGGFLPPG